MSFYLCSVQLSFGCLNSMTGNPYFSLHCVKILAISFFAYCCPFFYLRQLVSRFFCCVFFAFILSCAQNVGNDVHDYSNRAFNHCLCHFFSRAYKTNGGHFEIDAIIHALHLKHHDAGILNVGC